MSGGKTDEEQGATMQSTGDTDGPGAELYSDMMGKDFAHYISVKLGARH